MLPNNVKTRKRTIAHVDYRAGETMTARIPTGSLLLETWIRLSYTVTNGATSPSGPKVGGAGALIRRFDVEVADQDLIIGLDPIGMGYFNRQDFAKHPFGKDTISTTANSSASYEMWLPIAHWLPGSQNPLLTGIDLRYVQSAIARIEWGDASDLFFAPGDTVVSDVSCELVGVFFEGLGADVPSPLVRELGYRRYQVPLDDDQFQMQFEKRTGRLFRSIGLVTTRDKQAASSASGDAVLIKDLRIFSGGETMTAVPVDFLKAREHSFSQSDVPGAFYPISFADYGDPGQMLDSNRLQSALVLEAEVAGIRDGVDTFTEITAITEYVRPLRIS